MRSPLLFLAVVAVVAAGCGSTPTATETVPPTTTQVPVSPRPIAVTVYRVTEGLLHPEVMHVPRSPSFAAAALGALGLGATATIAGGTATVTVANATADETAEIVYTLTAFPSVMRVDVAGRRGLTRGDFARYLSPILIESPAAGAAVPLTFHVSGTASVFEATFVVQLVRDGKVIEKHAVTASEGAPGRGTFDTVLHAAAGGATVVAFSPSAADGSPQHEVDVPVTLQP